jgi:cytochrome c-type biogenesis protein CcmH
VKRGFQMLLLFLVVMTLLGADEDGRFQNLGHKLMCACSCNQVLLECNHVGCPLSDGMRHELTANVERGDSDDLVLQAFVQKYGPTVLLAPTTEGFNRTAWVMPYLALVFGLATVVFVIRSWKKRPLVLPEDAVAPVSGNELDHFREQARKDTEL